MLRRLPAGEAGGSFETPRKIAVKIGNQEFGGKTFVFAVINLTPDSFWEGSRHSEDAAEAALRAVREGAAVLDLGAQSTRPGYAEVDPDEEIRRLSGPLKEIRRLVDVPISVDTYFAEVAEYALSNGADMINDVWGLRDPDMAGVIARHRASVCIMHNRERQIEGDIWADIIPFLKERTKAALDAGIEKERICVDGGVGFAKSKEQNWELVRGYERLFETGYPLLLGTSRKSMFGGDVRDRLAPTLETTREAAQKGVLFVRVHDVKENAAAIEEEYGRDIRRKL